MFKVVIVCSDDVLNFGLIFLVFLVFFFWQCIKIFENFFLDSFDVNGFFVFFIVIVEVQGFSLFVIDMLFNLI